MTPPDDIARVVEGLTDAQRRFIAEKRRLLHLPGRWSDAFVKAGILVKGGGNWTELGLAVRKALETRHDAD